jgi:ketosteroid isomerase-like protein
MASSEERIELAQGGMDAFNEGDMARMLARLTPDVEVYASQDLVNGGEYRGHDGFVSWITTWIDAWEEIHTDVTENTPVGERHVVTAVHQTGRGRGSGIEVSMDIAFLFDVDDDGKCAFLAMLPTAEEAARMAEEREARA